MTEEPNASPTPAIVEAAARALCVHLTGSDGVWEDYVDDVQPVLAAITPLIEAAALEKAAKVADVWFHKPPEPKATPVAIGNAIATRIRALAPPAKEPDIGAANPSPASEGR